MTDGGIPPPRALRLDETGTRALVDRLTAIVARFAAVDGGEKLDLLDQLAVLPIRSPATLAKLHEALGFLRAYPDGPRVQERVERALMAFPARIARLGPPARARLYNSGIAGTTLDYPFGLPMARWLASRFPADVEVAWRRFEDTERLEELLPLLVTHQESEAFSEGGLHPRPWMALAKGRRRLSDLRTLLELFERAPLPLAVREALFEGLALPIEWRLRGAAPSRTLAVLTDGPRFMHGAGYGDGLRRGGVDFAREITRPLPPPRPAGRALSRSLIDMARASMATRARELYAFSHPNPNDVLVADPGRGLRVALIGLAPEFRLPVQAYYAFLLLKNGVPMSYGAGWGMWGRLEWALNVFEPFRRGESAFVASQILRVYYRVFRMRAVLVDRYQIGDENEEALRSGAFYFYRRLGFRPLDPAAQHLAEEEQAKVAHDPGYRSPRPVLRRLARTDLILRLPGPAPDLRLTASTLAALVARRIGHEFGGDRRAAQRADRTRVARALGSARPATWTAEERRWFERLTPLVALVANLEQWPPSERARLMAVIHAKGGPSELAYLRKLDRHRRLRLALGALVDRDPLP
jgi:hypothetical protein